jgi:hypothetical protein
MSLAPVHRFAQVRRFFEACRTRRADVAIVGDSNVYNAGTSGLAVGFAAAWGRRFGQYATGVHPPAVTGSFGLEFGATNNSYGSPDGLPPAPYAQYNPPVAVGTDPLYLPAGATDYAFKMGWDFATILPAHPNGIAGRLRWHFDYAAWAGGTHTINPVIRNVGGLSYAATAAAIDAATGTAGVARSYVEAAPGTRAGGGLIGQLQVHAGTGSPFNAGDLASWWHRWEWADIPVGVSVSCLCYQGGLGTRDHALMLQGMGQAAFTNWARMLVVAQAGTPTLCVNVISGQNDGDGSGGGSAALSVGPSPTASNTPAGVADNTAAVVDRLRALWTGAGYDVDDLYVLVGPYHPQEYSRRRWGRELDAALNAYADGESNVAVATRSRLSTSAFFSAKGWYAEAYPGDAHLTAGGYPAWAELAVNAIVPAPAVVLRHASGATLDLFVFDENGQVFDRVGGSFGPWADADLARYVIPGVEQGASGVYRFALPPNLPPRPAVLGGLVTERAGADPDVSDASVAAVDAGAFDGLRVTSADAAADDAADDLRVAVRRLSTLDALAYLDAPVSRAGTGAGAAAGDPHAGGADALRYVDGSGAGVGGATVRAYVKADYDAGAYVDRGRTATRSDGRWVAPLYLDAGVTYTVTFAKPGAYQLSKRDVSV